MQSRPGWGFPGQDNSTLDTYTHMRRQRAGHVLRPLSSVLHPPSSVQLQNKSETKRETSKSEANRGNTRLVVALSSLKVKAKFQSWLPIDKISEEQFD